MLFLLIEFFEEFWIGSRRTGRYRRSDEEADHVREVAAGCILPPELRRPVPQNLGPAMNPCGPWRLFYTTSSDVSRRRPPGGEEGSALIAVTTIDVDGLPGIFVLKSRRAIRRAMKARLRL